MQQDPLLCLDQSEFYAKIVCEENLKQIQLYKEGNVAMMGYLVGQIMIKSKGSVNPQFAQQALEKEISQR